MKCTYCNKQDTRVIETRDAGNDLRRRRECGACGQRFTTYERAEWQPIRIIKKNGSRELYSREKLLRGFLLACEKRPVTEAQIHHALEHIEQTLRLGGETEVQSRVIGDLAMEQLRTLDDVAYIRFASVYKEFRDAKHFEREVKVLTRGN